ncbi:unnamed protein product [Sympodiomycopsis kandeliae]
MSQALLSSIGAGSSRPTAQGQGQAQQGQRSQDGIASSTPGYSIEHHTDARVPTSVVPEETPQTLWQSITNPGSNPLLSAGFSLMILGAALGASRKALTQGASLAQRRMLVSLEIPSKDKAHGWLLGWMEEQARRSQAMPPMSARESLKDILGLRLRHPDGAGQSTLPPVRIHSRDLAVQSVLPSQKDSASSSNAAQQAMMMSGQPLPPGTTSGGDRQKATFSLVPGPGTHWFRYEGAWIRLQRERNAKIIDISTGAPWETLTLTTLYSSRSIFPRLLSEAQSLASQNIEGKTIIYTAWGVEWRSFGLPRKVRELESVVLSRGQKERIVDDVKSFLNRGKWYARRGIPYRRGYLLHGSPGSGKTSIIQALAGNLDMNICLLNLSERGLTDDKLNHLLSLAPEKSIILLEDIDVAFPSRTKSSEENKEYQTSVTFSGLLNALDGVTSGESRIIMMTTNHVERLDPALIRPGRIDLIEELGDADENMIKDLFERFYGVAREEALEFKNQDNVIDADTLQQLSAQLVEAVTQVSILRRKELGLDASGRYPLNSSPSSPPPVSSPATAVSSSSQTTTTRRTRATPLPAKRGGVSMAELQGLFIRYPSDPRGALQEIQDELDSVA